MTKVILISHIPLPYHEIGSWTTLYNNYILSCNSIDFIVCPKPKKSYDHLYYSYYNSHETFFDKLKRKFRLQNKWNSMFVALKSILISNSDKYIIQIVDNYGLGVELSQYLIKNDLRKNCYLQFFYHGYLPFNDEFIYQLVDEMVLLTHSSYTAMKKSVSSFPCKISILNNGIDNSKFYKQSITEKKLLKDQLDVSAKTVFLWCSQDRPKKGLDFILEVWKSLGKSVEDCELLVVGATRTIEIKGVRFLGQIPNDELPKYYQAADVYLFPTLCQEGFGMSLIEALHCGCYCIASSLGGVPEVLGYGKYGKLIEDPHFPDQWKSAILDYLDGDYNYEKLPKDKYSTKEWNTNMNRLIIDAKKSMS